ncbi:MAG TPA: hypothetical protein VGH74_02790 [Planctomycetaceae bacterium]
MAQNHINHAIRDCLAQCQSAANSADQIATFVAGLTAAGWTEDDIRSVETVVTKTLRAIADTATSRDDGLSG